MGVLTYIFFFVFGLMCAPQNCNTNNEKYKSVYGFDLCGSESLKKAYEILTKTVSPAKDKGYVNMPYNSATNNVVYTQSTQPSLNPETNSRGVTTPF